MSDLGITEKMDLKNFSLNDPSYCRVTIMTTTPTSVETEGKRGQGRCVRDTGTRGGGCRLHILSNTHIENIIKI